MLDDQDQNKSVAISLPLYTLSVRSEVPDVSHAAVEPAGDRAGSVRARVTAASHR